MNFRSESILLFFLLTSFYSIAQTEAQKDTASNNNDSLGVFEKVDIDASFPGGVTAWRKFLESNLRGDVPAKNGAPAGIYTVWVQFIVDRQGLLTDIKTLTDNGYGMEQEVLRLIKICPQWHPAIQNGRMVKAYRKQPVTFMIEEDGLEVSLALGTALYIGTANPVTINCPKVKDKYLRVTISKGDISGIDGNYVVHETGAGRATIEVYNKDKKVGSFSVDVLPLPQTFKKK